MPKKLRPYRWKGGTRLKSETGKSSSRLDTSTLTLSEPEKHSIVTPSKRLDNASKQLRHNGAVLRLTNTTMPAEGLQFVADQISIYGRHTHRGSLHYRDAMWRIERELSTTIPALSKSRS